MPYFVLLVGTIFARTKADPCRNVIGAFGLLVDGRLNDDAVINTLMFIPFTYLMLMAFSPVRPARTCLIASFALTCLIEAVQLVFRLGEFSLADIVHNTLGGMIGCGLWLLVKRITGGRRAKNRRRGQAV